MLSNNSPGRVNVDADNGDYNDFEGEVSIEDGFPTFGNAQAWVSLDGISFRCAPSGSGGCP